MVGKVLDFFSGLLSDLFDILNGSRRKDHSTKKGKKICFTGRLRLRKRSNVYSGEGIPNKEVPLDLFEQMLSYLDGLSLQATAMVSKVWNKATIDTAKKEETKLVKNFVSFLVENLDEKLYPDLRKKLINLNTGEINNSINLLEVKSSLLSFKKTLIDALKEVRNEAKVKTGDGDLDRLEELSKNINMPALLKDIFEVLQIYKKIESNFGLAREMPPLAYDLIGEHSIKLAKLGYFDRAIEVANSIPWDNYKTSALEKIEIVRNGGNVTTRYT